MPSEQEVALLFEPRPVIAEASKGWRMFKIEGTRAAVILWVKPADLTCERCGVAYYIHDNSMRQMSRAVGVQVVGRYVCLCEGSFIE